ncbi:MAG: TPM domain-containing protein [Desulfuromonadales bacterium]
MRWSLNILFATILLLPLCAAAVEIPAARGYVNDRADILAPATERKLEQFLRGFEQSDSTQIVVLTVPSLEGEPVEAYAIQAAQAWGIGQKGKDNGALLLIARDERKIRIEVGYGLEGRLTDLLAGRIVDYEISPRFRAGDFDSGVLAGVQAMAEAVRGEYQGAGRTSRRDGERSPWGLLALLLFLGPGLLRLSGGRGAHRRGGFYVGGPFGGRGGGFGGGGGFSGGGGGFGGGGASGGW